MIVGPMYRVGEGYVCEEEAKEEEKANGPVEPAKNPYLWEAGGGVRSAWLGSG